MQKKSLKDKNHLIFPLPFVSARHLLNCQKCQDIALDALGLDVFEDVLEDLNVYQGDLDQDIAVILKEDTTEDVEQPDTPKMEEQEDV